MKQNQFFATHFITNNVDPNQGENFGIVVES
jgi:hypothetical protein